MKNDQFKLFRIVRIVDPFLMIAILLAGHFRLSALLIISIVLFVIAVFITTFWECPNCKKLFCTKFDIISTNWPYISKCVHCGYDMNADNTA